MAVVVWAAGNGIDSNLRHRISTKRREVDEQEVEEQQAMVISGSGGE